MSGQCRWAADLLLQDDDRQAFGIAALGGTPRGNNSGRFISKKDANRAAAARVYIAASKKAGKPVPASAQRLARQGG